MGIIILDKHTNSFGDLIVKFYDLKTKEIFEHRYEEGTHHEWLDFLKRKYEADLV